MAGPHSITAEANRLRRNHQLSRAGDHYTRAAYWALATAEGIPHRIAIGLPKFHYAALCYRVGGEMGRCRNRSEQAILVTEDARDHLFAEDARDHQFEPEGWQGVAEEFIGDYRTIGDLDRSDEAYDAARAHYESLERELSRSNLIGWADEMGFHESVRFVPRLAKIVGHSIDDERRDEVELTLTGRVRFKREFLSTLVEQAVDRGDLVWEDDP